MGTPSDIDVTLTEQDRTTLSAMTELLGKTPRNEFGFPLGIYRPDLLPWHDHRPEGSAVAELFSLDASNVSTQEQEVIRHADEEGQEREVQSQEAQSERALRLKDFTEEELEILAEEDLLDLGLENNGAGIEDLDTAVESVAQPHLYANLPAHPLTPPPQSDRIAGFRRQDLIPAFVPLNFDEGFPTLPDGRPCWERLEFEPADANIAFQAYLQMPKVTQGTRSLGDLPDVMVANKLLGQSVGKGVGTAQDFTAKFRYLFVVYNWALRCKAYDLFMTAAYRKRQEFRSMALQEDHFSIASKIKRRVLEYIDSEEEFWDMMTPKVAIELFKTVMGMERLSAGLPASAPATEKTGQQPGQSFEMILRTLAQQQSPRIEDSEGTVLEGTAGHEALARKILSDPQLTTMAQELILRITK